MLSLKSEFLCHEGGSVLTCYITMVNDVVELTWSRAGYVRTLDLNPLEETFHLPLTKTSPDSSE